MDFIYGFHLSSSNSSKAVTKQKCYKNWLVSTWRKLSMKENFKLANRNVCFKTVRQPLHEARYENRLIWNWKKSYRLLVKFIRVFRLFRNDIKFISGKISYQLICLIWNSTPDVSHSAHIYRTGLCMKTWKMITVSLKISFVDCSKVFLIVL